MVTFMTHVATYVRTYICVFLTKLNFVTDIRLQKCAWLQHGNYGEQQR